MDYAHAHIEKIQADIAKIKEDIGYLHNIVIALRRDIHGTRDLAFEKIILLENKVFPGISRDISRLEQIVGSAETPGKINQLDRKRPETP